MPYRVYYDDGTISENEVTQPWRVVCIVQPRERTGREVLHAYPYYVYTDQWYGVEDLPSFVQQMMYRVKDVTQVVMGIWIDDATYQAIVKRATEDEGLPRRSSKAWDRRR